MKRHKKVLFEQIKEEQQSRRKKKPSAAYYTNSLARGEPLDPRTEKGRDAAAFFRFLLGTKGTIACAQ